MTPTAGGSGGRNRRNAVGLVWRSNLRRGWRRGWHSPPWSAQATTTAFTGFVVGLPLGAAAGRLVWSSFATNIGVIAVTRVPGWSLASLAVGVLVLANALAVPVAVVARHQSTLRLLTPR